MRGWHIVLIGGFVCLLAVLAIPGMPACKYCGQVYTSTFMQNVAYPILGLAVGIIILLIGFFRMGQENPKH